MVVKLLNLAALLGALAIGITLWAWGQPLLSTSGEIQLFVPSIWSSENSQQIADWYSFSHTVHGLLLALVWWGVRRWTGYAPVYAVAIATGTAWEIVEHTNWVLDKFRAVTVYQGYVGDTVLNAVMDYVFMIAGFYLGTLLRPLWVALLIVVLELGSALIARDCLTLTTIHTLYPIEALDAWQDEINPRTHPELLEQGGD
jgi:hypothetical protein